MKNKVCIFLLFVFGSMTRSSEHKSSKSKQSQRTPVRATRVIYYLPGKKELHDYVTLKCAQCSLPKPVIQQISIILGNGKTWSKEEMAVVMFAVAQQYGPMKAHKRTQLLADCLVGVMIERHTVDRQNLLQEFA